MITYRTMHTDDIDQVFEVRISTRENTLGMARLAELGITPESIAQALAGSAQGWVGEDDDRVVGFTMADGESGEMLVLAILPDYEGRGIGRRLMEMTQTWLFSQGHREIWLLENPDPSIRAFGFYRNLGWYPTGEYRGDEQVLKLRSDHSTDSQSKPES